MQLSLIPVAPPGFKSGFVGIVGRPNVGKSTLMNQLVGQKIAITSPIAQTTRNRLQGILTTPEAQFIFVDTPGIHKPHHQLGEVLVKTAQMAIRAVDVVLFVVDCSVEAGGGDRYIVNLLSQVEIPVIMGLNKVDQQPANKLLETSFVDPPKLVHPPTASASPSTPHPSASTPPHPLDTTYTELVAPYGWELIKFSALTGEGLTELQQALCDRLAPGPYYYPPDLVTDQPERFIMGELIREQILLQTREEVPHSVAVLLDRVEEQPTITNILATIYVERPSQKAILLGKGGSMIKAIGTEARAQIQKLILGKVYLELFVKVQPKWRQSRVHLADLGYRSDG